MLRICSAEPLQQSWGGSVSKPLTNLSSITHIRPSRNVSSNVDDELSVSAGAQPDGDEAGPTFGPLGIRRDPFRPWRGFVSERFYGISKVNLVRKFGIDPIKKPDELRRLSEGFMAPPVCRHLASYFLHEENIFRDKFALNPIKYENTYLLSLSDCFSLVSAAPHPPDGKELYDCNYASLMICLPPPAHQPARVPLLHACSPLSLCFGSPLLL